MGIVKTIGRLSRATAGQTKNITRTMGLGQHALGLSMAVGTSAIGMSNGQSAAGAIAMGVGTYFLESAVPGAFMLSTVADVAGMATTAYIENKRYGNSKIHKYYRGNFGGNFQDTQAGYTMRQRGVAAIQQSQLNARSVLGSEARTYHTTY